MKKKDHYLVKKIKAMRGQVIVIGGSDAVLDAINQNDGITTCFTLNNLSRISGKYKKTGSGRSINIKKFKRKFKKKKTNVLIVDSLDVVEFSRYFVSSSIYITKETIYYVAPTSSEKVEEMIGKYQRYQISIEKIPMEDGLIYRIDCSGAKNSRIKDWVYFITDSVEHFIDILGDYLIN